MSIVNGSIQIANYTQAEWQAWNGVLKSGQIAISTDQFYGTTNAPKYKVGNGVDTWANLDYHPDTTGGAPSTSQTGGMSMTIEAPEDADYFIFLKLPYGITITETTTICTSGTATATFKINATPLGGTANAISNVEQSQAHASANVAAANDDIVVTISANSSCVKATLTVKYTYTLA